MGFLYHVRQAAWSFFCTSSAFSGITRRRSCRAPPTRSRAAPRRAALGSRRRLPDPAKAEVRRVRRVPDPAPAEDGRAETARGCQRQSTSRLLDSRASVAVFDGRAPRRERAEKLVWAARFPRASYPTVCGQKFRARRRSRRQKSSFSARLLRQPLTVERRSHAMGRPPQNDRALPDRALGHSLCYWRRFW